MWRWSNSAANGSPVGDAPGAPLPAAAITRGHQSGAGHGRRHAKAPLPHESAEPTSAPAANDADLNGAAVADGAGSRSSIQIAEARLSRCKTTQSLRSDEAKPEEIGRMRSGGGDRVEEIEKWIKFCCPRPPDPQAQRETTALESPARSSDEPKPL